jgi:hypothetical protein
MIGDIFQRSERPSTRVTLINDFSLHHLIHKFSVGRYDYKVFCLRKISEIYFALEFVTLKKQSYNIDTSSFELLSIKTVLCYHWLMLSTLCDLI